MTIYKETRERIVQHDHGVRFIIESAAHDGDHLAGHISILVPTQRFPHDRLEDVFVNLDEIQRAIEQARTKVYGR